MCPSDKVLIQHTDLGRLATGATVSERPMGCFQNGYLALNHTFLCNQKIGSDEKVMNLTGGAVNIHWTRETEKSIDAAPLVFPAGWRPDFDRIQVVGRDSAIALFSGNGVLIYDIVGVSDQSVALDEKRVNLEQSPEVRKDYLVQAQHGIP